MADNSGRETIVQYVVTQLEELKYTGILKDVTRQVPEYDTLREWASAQAATRFPLAIVVGGMPVPTEHVVSRSAGGVDVIQSNLPINIYVVDTINVDVDTRLSYLADEIWAKLYESQTKGGAAWQTRISFGSDVLYLQPVIAFRVAVNITYQHTTGGI